MKRWTRITALALLAALFATLLSGCGLFAKEEEVTDPVQVLADNVNAAIAAAGSVEASIFLDIQAHIGTAGTTGSHTASVESDITVQSTFSPYAYYSETFSRILVDGVSTREDTEVYAVPASNSIDYIQYNYNAKDDVWTQQTLTQAEVRALPLKTCLIHDWTAYFRGARLEKEAVSCNDKTTNMYVGNVDSSILQELMNNGIFGSFLFSLEQLLSDQLICTVYIEQGTNLPVQMVVEFDDSFTVSDMVFDTALITVDYSDWGALPEIAVPKKVTVVSADLDAEFYASYFAWNLFLPYLQSATNPNPGNNGDNQAFASSWETFQIRIDNSMTSLPIPFDELRKAGYTIDISHENIVVEPNMYVENVPVHKNRDLVYCVFYNDTTEALPISSCKVGRFDVAAADQTENGISVFLPGNVTLGVTLDFVISAYDTADEITKSFSADTYVWKVANAENQTLLIEINPKTTEVIRIQLTYIPVTGGKQ